MVYYYYKEKYMPKFAKYKIYKGFSSCAVGKNLGHIYGRWPCSLSFIFNTFFYQIGFHFTEKSSLKTPEYQSFFWFSGVFRRYKTGALVRNELRNPHNIFKILTHFSPMPHFYTPRKRQKTISLLTFSGGIEMWHWTKMS